jgi:small subunit ribosomal protein S8
MNTDPIADLLTRIKNASVAKEDEIQLPASRVKANILRVLRDEGFINSFKIFKEGERAFIKVSLKYSDKGQPVIKGLRRVSWLGLRRYVGSDEVAKVRSGAGLAIISTSKGVITGKNAKSQRVGGEYICEVW